MAQNQYLDLTGLGEFKGLIDTELAKSFKSAKFDESTRVLSLYKADTTDGDADFTVEIPETDVSGLMEKLTGATENNIVVVGANGTVKDSGVSVGDIASMKGQIEALVAGTYDDSEIRNLIQGNTDDITELDGRVTSAEGNISTLVGTDTNKSVRTIANEELAVQLIPEGAKESLNTLQEIAAWIQSHPDSASAMNEAISKLEGIVDGIGDVDSGEKATIVAYITDAIAALKIGDYAKVADLTTLAERMTSFEGLVTSEKVAKWDVAETNAKTYADSLAVNYDSAGSASAAETNSKTYADGLNTAMNTKVTGVTDRVTELENKVGDGMTAITSDAINALFATE